MEFLHKALQQRISKINLTKGAKPPLIFEIDSDKHMKRNKIAPHALRDCITSLMKGDCPEYLIFRIHHYDDIAKSHRYKLDSYFEILLAQCELLDWELIKKLSAPRNHHLYIDFLNAYSQRAERLFESKYGFDTHTAVQYIIAIMLLTERYSYRENSSPTGETTRDMWASEQPFTLSKEYHDMRPQFFESCIPEAISIHLGSHREEESGIVLCFGEGEEEKSQHFMYLVGEAEEFTHAEYDSAQSDFQKIGLKRGQYQLEDVKLIARLVKTALNTEIYSITDVELDKGKPISVFEVFMPILEGFAYKTTIKPCSCCKIDQSKG